jgi:hypothetical protein
MLTTAENGKIPHCVTYGLAATLCLLAPFVVFLSFHSYPHFAVEVLPLYLIPAAVGVLLATLFRLRLVKFAQFLLCACLVVAIIYLHDLYAWLSVTALAVICGLLVWKLRHNAPVVIAIAAALHIASTFGLNGLGLSRTDRSTMTQIAALAENEANDHSPHLPPVLHLVMDEFTGLRGLPYEVPGARKLASDLESYYLQNGFYLASHAYSQYAGTYNTVPRLMNFSASDYRFEHLSSNKGRSKWTVEVNKYFEILSDFGYELHIYQSAFINFCRPRNVAVTSCSTYSHNSIGTIADKDIPIAQKTKFILTFFVYSSSRLVRQIRGAYNDNRKKLGANLPAWQSGQRRTGPMAVSRTVSQLKDALSQLRPGEVHFAHLLIPHNPFILNADCSPKTQDEEWLNALVTPDTGGGLDVVIRELQYRRYFGQVECTQLIIDRLFAAIRSSGQWERAIIIIHGDHGTRLGKPANVPNLKTMSEDDFRDTYSAFFAFKGGISHGILDARPMPLQFLLSQAWLLPSPALDRDAWQLPPPQENQHFVYVHKFGWPGLEATRLKGFGPIEDMQSDD